MKRAFLLLLTLSLFDGCTDESSDSAAGGSAGVSAGGSSAKGGSAGASAGTSAGANAAGVSGKAGEAGAIGSGGSATSGNGGISGTSNSAGSAGTSAGNSSAGGPGVATPECEVDEDCRLFSDCCQCTGLALKETDPAACKQACAENVCDALRIEAATCISGRCVAGIECDDSDVTCATPGPECGPGKARALITTQGDTPVTECTDVCVPTTECLSVRDCKACQRPAEECIATVTQFGTQYHCVNVPPACSKEANCECLGPSVCVEPYTSCSSDATAISCFCPAC